MDDYLNQSNRNMSFSFNAVAQFLFILLVAKFFKSFGIYICYDLLKQIHIVQLLFFSLLIASIVYFILQRPLASSNSSSNKTLSRFQYLKIVKYSLIQTFIKLLWLFGLTQCGPFRTTLIYEQSEFVVLCALKAIFLSQSNPTRSRGVILLLTGTLILLAFDYDDIRAKVNFKKFFLIILFSYKSSILLNSFVTSSSLWSIRKVATMASYRIYSIS